MGLTRGLPHWARLVYGCSRMLGSAINKIYCHHTASHQTFLILVLYLVFAFRLINPSRVWRRKVCWRRALAKGGWAEWGSSLKNGVRWRGGVCWRRNLLKDGSLLEVEFVEGGEFAEGRICWRRGVCWRRNLLKEGSLLEDEFVEGGEFAGGGICWRWGVCWRKILLKEESLLEDFVEGGVFAGGGEVVGGGICWRRGVCWRRILLKKGSLLEEEFVEGGEFVRWCWCLVSHPATPPHTSWRKKYKPKRSINTSRISNAVLWISLFFELRFGVTFCMTVLMTGPRCWLSWGVISSIVCKANRFTLLLLSWSRGLNLSNIWNMVSDNEDQVGTVKKRRNDYIQ